MIKHRNKPVLACKELRIQENGLNKFHTIVSEVWSFVGNPVNITSATFILRIKKFYTRKNSIKHSKMWKAVELPWMEILAFSTFSSDWDELCSSEWKSFFIRDKIKLKMFSKKKICLMIKGERIEFFITKNRFRIILKMFTFRLLHNIAAIDCLINTSF